MTTYCETPDPDQEFWKLQKTNFMVAHSALAHKLARAAYHVIKEQTPFMPEKLFAS